MVDRRHMAKRLYQARKMRTPEEVKSFEAARLALFSTGDSSVLNDLFAALDDSTEQHEVMWGLVHDAEAFDREVYLRELAIAVPGMLPHAKDWVLLLHQRILNRKELLPLYRDIIVTLPPETEGTIRQLLEEISKSKPKFSKRVRDFLKERRK